MSCVCMIAADHPLPLQEPQARRTQTVQAEGRTITLEEDGFSVQPHKYYRPAVEELGLAMKPHQYELDLRATEEDAAQLCAYLRENCAPGEQVELWALWVGDGGGKVHRYRGKLSEFDLDTLEMLCETQWEPDLTGEFDNLTCQVCVTVELDLPG